MMVFDQLPRNSLTGVVERSDVLHIESDTFSLSSIYSDLPDHGANTLVRESSKAPRQRDGPLSSFKKTTTSANSAPSWKRIATNPRSAGQTSQNATINHHSGSGVQSTFIKEI